LTWGVCLQRSRGPSLPTVFEISGPEPAGSPPLGGSPTAVPLDGRNEFNAAAYLQRKSAIQVDLPPQSLQGSRGDAPLDHRIPHPQGSASMEYLNQESELQFGDDHPLLGGEEE